MDGQLRNMTSIYITNEDKLLLLYRQGGRVVNNVWIGSAGGHFEKEELNDAKACILRELREELGIGEECLEGLALRYVTLRRTNGEIRQNYYFFASLKKGIEKPLTSNEGISQWFSYEAVQSLEMPYTAQYVVAHFCETGRFNDKMYVGITGSNGVTFVELEEY